MGFAAHIAAERFLVLPQPRLDLCLSTSDESDVLGFVLLIPTPHVCALILASFRGVFERHKFTKTFLFTNCLDECWDNARLDKRQGNYFMKKKEKSVIDNIDDLITVTEAAELRGVWRAALHELVKRGRLRAEKKFGRVLLYRDEVAEFEKSRP